MKSAPTAALKTVISLLLLLCTALLSAQILGGRSNGQSASSEVKPAEISGGAFQGDVNLFSGTYGASYPLGSVSTPSGLSFSASLSYSSSFESGDNMPPLAGIPYGEGWSLGIPMISVSTEDFNKYTKNSDSWLKNLSNCNSITFLDGTVQPTANPPEADVSTPFFLNSELPFEGDAYWFSPRLSIPGVASGRLVYKYMDRTELPLSGNFGEDSGDRTTPPAVYVFVLHQFEKYVEARTTDGHNWTVILDDGTRYEFGVATISETSGPNQRQKNLYATGNGTQYPERGMMLPRTSITSWYATRIYHPNILGEIHFNYESFGCFDYYNELDLHEGPINAFYDNTNSFTNTWNVCREIYLQEVNSGTEKLVFKHATDFTQVSVNGVLQTPKNVIRFWGTTPPGTRLDSLYTWQTVFSSNSTTSQTWRRFLHLKSFEAETGNPNLPSLGNYLNNTGFTGNKFAIGPDNPYAGLLNVTNCQGSSLSLMLRKNVSVPNGSTFIDIDFNHSFIESPAISISDLPAGDLYQIRTVIWRNANPDNINSCNFDINFVSGDHSNETTGEPPVCSFLSMDLMNKSCVDKLRGSVIFSTFNQAVKWRHLWSQIELETSNYFTLANLPGSVFKKGFIQIGPANSDNKFNDDPTPYMEVGSFPGTDRSYWNFHAANDNAWDTPVGSLQCNASKGMRSGDEVPASFGVGLSWYMLKNWNGQSFAANADKFWWSRNRSPLVPNEPFWHDRPTLATQNQYSLQKVELIRYAKNPYMLRSVIKYVCNPIAAAGEYTKDGMWTMLSNQKLEYEVKEIELLSIAHEKGNSALFIKYTDSNRKRDVYLLSKIKSIPIKSAGYLGGYVESTDAPTTFFFYSEINAPSLTCPPPCLFNVYNSRFFGLTKVVTPIGGETEIAYQDIEPFNLLLPGFVGNNPPVGKSYSLPKFYYRLRFYNDNYQLNSPDNIACNYTGQTKVKGLPYAYQTNMIVKSVKIADNLGLREWQYDFTDGGLATNGVLVRDMETPYLPDERYFLDRQADVAVGYRKTIVLGPEIVTGTREKRILFHFTDENRYLLWGKPYKTQVWEVKSGSSDLLHTETTTDYKVSLAFENIYTRGYKNTTFGTTDYYDYSEYATAWNKPAIIAPASNEWNHDYLKTYYYPAVLTWLGTSKAAPAEQTDVPDFLMTPDFTSVPALDAKTGIIEGPHFLESKKEFVLGITHTSGSKDYGLHQRNATYLNSYFIRPTKETSRTYDKLLTSATIQSVDLSAVTSRDYIESVTEYSWFDADYRGRSSSPGYADLGVTNAATNGLKWEPSWQLHSTKKYSPQQPNTYLLEENFYFYDLANVAAYQDALFKVASGLRLLNDVWLKKKMRSLAFQKRVTQVVSGQTEIKKSVFYIHDDLWNADTEAATVYENTALNSYAIGGVQILSGSISFAGEPIKVSYSSSTDSPYYYPSNEPGYPIPGMSASASISNLISKYTDDLPVDEYNRPMGCLFSTTSVTGFVKPIASVNVWCKSSTAKTLNADYKIYLRKVFEQVQPIAASGVLSFSTVAADNFKPLFSSAQDTVVLQTILRRNHFGQIIRESDARGLITNHDLGTLKWVETRYSKGGIERFLMVPLVDQFGLKKSVTVGYNLPDALTSTMTYNVDNSIKDATDPNLTKISWLYDFFGRMKEQQRNGIVLQKVIYKKWGNNLGVSFAARAVQNYVEKEIFTSSKLGTISLKERQYVDPLGRNIGQSKDQFLMQDIIYDRWDRAITTIKPVEFAAGNDPKPSITTPAGLLVANRMDNQYENTPLARLVKSSKFGQDITSGTAKVTKNAYGYVDRAVLTTFLNGLLSSTSAALIQGDRFARNMVMDEDGKYVLEFINPLGQKVASVGLNGQTATLMIYDSQGNVKTVINPKEQTSTYLYNFRNQLYQQTTIDEGSKKFVYDRGGLLIGDLDAKNVLRVYRYDAFGRMIYQKANIAGNSALFSAFWQNEGNFWVLTANKSMAVYSTTILGHALTKFERQLFYHTFPSAYYPSLATTNIANYVTGATGLKGRPTMTLTYNNGGSGIAEIKYFSYDTDGFLKWEINQFNYNPITSTAKGMAVAIDYPDYTRMGSVLTQRMDLDCDGILDFRYSNTYDSWNRLSSVSADYLNTITYFTIATLEYDNISGAVKAKKYFDHTSDCNNVEVDQLNYTYDTRFRLTNIGSTLFDYELAYDANAVTGNGLSQTQNFNGNINSTKSTYKLTGTAANPSTFSSWSSWNYTYDNLNRLTKATVAGVESANLFGNSDYSYDKIGNFLTLNRFISSTTQDNYTYGYLTGNNRLEKITRPGNVIDRSITYDANGNMITDTKRKVTSTTYGRMNLPFQQNININATQTKILTELYDAADARTYKRSVTQTGNVYPPPTVVNGAEYYIHDGAGKELGVYDFLADKLYWYVFAGDRVAKILHTPVTTYGEGLGLDAPCSDTRNSTTPDKTQEPPTGKIATTQAVAMGGGSLGPGNLYLPKYFFSAVYADINDLKATVDAGSVTLMNCLSHLLTPEGDLLLPNRLVFAKSSLTGKSDWYLLDSPDGVPSGMTVTDTIPLTDAMSQVIVWLNDTTPVPVRVGDVLGLFPPLEVASDTSFTPETGMAQAAAAGTIIPQPTFYISDHLGSTRVTYHVDVVCPATKTYVLDYAAEYYPYGKTLREYAAGGVKEKYATTQHERDQETGFDYRGARFYDSDIARFLSVDPLAKRLFQISPFNYVLSNPLLLIDPNGKEPVVSNTPPHEYIFDQQTGEFRKMSDNGGSNVAIINHVKRNGDGSYSSTSPEPEIYEGKWAGSINGMYAADIEFYERQPSYNPDKAFASLFPAQGTITPVDDPITGLGRSSFSLGEAGAGSVIGIATSNPKYSFGQLRNALERVLTKLGLKEGLEKADPGKWGSPQRGDRQKGYRLDKEGHPNTTKSEEKGPHINWWDWTRGKRGKGGESGAESID